MGIERKIDKKSAARFVQAEGEQPERLSRTQKKKIALSLQDMGEQLVKLSDDQIKQIGLPDDLLAAVRSARTIKKHGARGRQMQYIGSLMRKCDPTPIREFLASWGKRR